MKFRGSPKMLGEIVDSDMFLMYYLLFKRFLMGENTLKMYHMALKPIMNLYLTEKWMVFKFSDQF